VNIRVRNVTKIELFQQNVALSNENATLRTQLSAALADNALLRDQVSIMKATQTLVLEPARAADPDGMSYAEARDLAKQLSVSKGYGHYIAALANGKYEVIDAATRNARADNAAFAAKRLVRQQTNL
jgi:hypothetical protein